MPNPILDRVTLKGMRFHTHIGVLPHEAEIAQSIEVDISVWVTAGVVDYRELYDIAARVLSEGHIKYLEEVGQRVCASALKLSGVSRVAVAVRKPHVALGGPLDYAEVEVERSQD